MGYINKLHLSHEVVENAERASALSKAFSSDNRYNYKADAILMGYAPLEPFMPIYLEGLKDRNSGIWVVIAVNHQFDMRFPYSMHVHLGTNDYLLSIPKPSGAVHVTEPNGTMIIDENSQPASLSNIYTEKTGGYYYQETNSLPTPENKLLNKPKLYDPVLDYLSMSSTDNPSNSINTYDVYPPSVPLEKSRQWKRGF